MAAEKTYRIAPRIIMGRTVYMSVALWFAPVFLLLGGEPIEPLLIGLFGVIWLLTLAIYAVASRRSGLVVSPQGITYRELGITISSTWDNIERIDKHIIYAEGEVEGLVLREPGWQPNALIAGSTAIMKLSLQNRMAARTLDIYRTFIPLSSLQTKGWRNAEIGEDIRRYAPHLFP